VLVLNPEAAREGDEKSFQVLTPLPLCTRKVLTKYYKNMKINNILVPTEV
jgi:hypothetical protein